MSYTPENIDEIVARGQDRLPNEACGIVIRGTLFEIPNRALDREKNSVMFTTDILELLEQFEDVEPSEVTVWHTHPSDTASPSEEDLANKPAEGPGSQMIYLVVAVPSGVATVY